MLDPVAQSSSSPSQTPAHRPRVRNHEVDIRDYEPLLKIAICSPATDLSRAVKQVAQSEKHSYQECIVLGDKGYLNWQVRSAIKFRGKKLYSGWFTGYPLEAVRRSADAGLFKQLLTQQRYPVSKIKIAEEQLRISEDQSLPSLPKQIKSAAKLLQNLHLLGPSWSRADYDTVDLICRGPNKVVCRAKILHDGKYHSSSYIFGSDPKKVRELAAANLLGLLIKLNKLDLQPEVLEALSKDQKILDPLSLKASRHTLLWEIGIISKLKGWELSLQHQAPAVTISLKAENLKISGNGASRSNLLNAKGEAAKDLYGKLQDGAVPAAGDLFSMDPLKALNALCELLKLPPPVFTSKPYQSRSSMREQIICTCKSPLGVSAVVSELKTIEETRLCVADDMRALLLLAVSNLSPK